jgi:2-polyprenyl-6-methoxyphenol hydroxylase-like FAD-dependent oxidoreductase
MSSHERLRVLIIGAGTGGLCLAQGLKQAGIDVAVYERDRTRADGLQGYRVGIDADGSRALHACLPPELFATFVATCARAPRYFNILTERLDEVLSLPLPQAANPAESEQSVSRMTLRQVLLTGLEEKVHFDKTFAHYAQHADGSVTAYFEDGTSATGDLLVGADGTSSRVRQQYLPHARLEEVGILAVAGKMPLTDEVRRLLPPKVLNGISLVMAPRGYGAIIHVMEFPWDRDGVKPGIATSDANLLARWPGLLFDNTRDYAMWGFNAATHRFPADLLQRQGADLLPVIERMTRGWHPDWRTMLALSDPSTCFPVNIRTSAPIPAWPSNNVTLLGDAIHTMTPGRGIGANTALRDAELLCRNLIATRDGTLSLLAAVADYEERMRGYAYEAVESSREQMFGGSLLHKPVVGRIVLEGIRAGMRVANRVPAIKQRMLDGMQRERGKERNQVASAAT